MSNSTHDVVVYKLGPVTEHPAADQIEIHHVWNYVCISQKGLYKEGDLVAFIPPDNVVPDIEQYAWLSGKRRIRAKKIRGIVSYGLLVAAPEGSIEGDVVTEQLGVAHYEPPILTSNGGGFSQAKPPPGYYAKYDIDSLQRYADCLEPGEEVWITEKLHGCCFSAIYIDGALHVQSHNFWRKEDDDNVFWPALRNTPGLAEWLEEHPGTLLQGEVVPTARVAKTVFDYGYTWGTPRVVLFDMSQDGSYFSHEVARGLSKDLTWVPTIGREAFSLERAEELTTGPSLMPGANHLREGLVLTPVNERMHDRIGRIKLKLVSHKYLEL